MTREERLEAVGKRVTEYVLTALKQRGLTAYSPLAATLTFQAIGNEIATLEERIEQLEKRYEV